MSWTDATEAFATALPGYEPRVEQDRLATTIEQALADQVHLLAQAGCGCIQGDAELNINRAGNGSRITLRDLVVRFNGGHTDGQVRRWDPTIPTYVQREIDGVVRRGRILHAWYSGEKTTYTVTTDTGRTVRATDEHPFLTERGWLRLDELKVDDEVHVRGEQGAGRSRQAKLNYRRICVLPHPFRNQKTVCEHRLVAEADLNGLSYDDFLVRVRAGDLADLKFLDPDVWAVHHKDHDTLNNALSNLQVMTHSEHHALHAAEGKTNQVLFKIVTERVVSVERHGDEDTYDIEVADDPHNFIVNGFVVHNTGKSFANLVPAIDRARATGKPVVISTATKALQGQYFKKDLPFLAETLGEFRYELLKGRSNYVCLAKFNDAEAETVSNINSLREELDSDEHHRGDMDDLITEISFADRGKLTVSTDECPGRKECPFGAVCYAEVAKDRAQDAQVVVANHALLVRDLLIRGLTEGVSGLLPDYANVVIDEGHELEEYTTGALGEELSEKGLRRLADDIEKLVGDSDVQLSGAAVKLFSQLDKVLGKNTTLAVDDDLLVDLFGEIEATLDQVLALLGLVRNFRPTTDSDAIRRKQLTRRVQAMANRLSVILGTKDTPEVVRWIEREDRVVRGNKQSTIKFCFAPIHVGPFLSENLWSRVSTVVTSATLAVGDDFSYLAGRLGMDQHEHRAFDAGTPFDFAKQAVLYVPSGKYPEPREGSWGARTAAEIGELVRSSQGRALLLFTSRKAMNEAYSILSASIRKQGYTVLIQEPGIPTAKLAAEFAADEHSVLFGLRSFMTGADFQGDTCRLVVLDKLPFAVPTDVMLNARCEAIDAVAKNKWVDGSFPTMTVPSMALTLLQAFGRAVRTKNDEALIAVFDPRLRTKRYGGTILRALPPASRVDNLGDARAYLDELEQRRP